MQIYVDGAIVYSVNSANLDGTISVASGPHNLIIKGWDNAGRNFYKQIAVTINKPPIAALTLSSGSILVGGSITASASGSTDADGTIASTVISFGDGSSATAVSASHQYKTAGTYTVKATVTDNLGASSSTGFDSRGEAAICYDHQPNVYFDHIDFSPRHGDVFLGLPSGGDAGLSGWRDQIPIVNSNGGHNSADHSRHTPDHDQGLGLFRCVVHVVTNRHQKLRKF